MGGRGGKNIPLSTGSSDTSFVARSGFVAVSSRERIVEAWRFLFVNTYLCSGALNDLHQIAMRNTFRQPVDLTFHHLFDYGAQLRK